ncbi:MAG: TetR/AcrR family transcriptional regulator, partial [Candidatus Phaeomarinobacter sp.]
MARTSNARQQLIETAARLFQSRGFHGTGLSLILEESGAPKGSFYHHFPGGKDELAVAAMQWSSLEIEEFI